ncbi:mitochondrial thiamine pyrophosphate carrier [Anopheles bellator]|uniref:mitochondrial thiamine pyrophosphate carrier n=1 Tax=Anopheles bellator TaxID=139047 RepID=UPI0026492B44|nr:mitochondrial thiamine pyrophosphate carrier [Anopheles bellator]XP_058065328.1 mitochondrial thiamine pyrophosphate carrier [Anopheles bellator]
MDREKHSEARYAGLAGGMTGCITRFICQPLDVLKIRLQLQVEPIATGSSHSKYRSIGQSVVCIYREEGLLAFWKGHNPAQLLSLVYGVAQFSFYERFNRLLRETAIFAGHDRGRNFICGACSGSFAALVIMPLDVIRTRLVSQDPGRGYNNAAQGLMHIYRSEGVRGLYRGAGPAMLQIAPLTGGQFMFYNLFGTVAKQIRGLSADAQLPAVELFVYGGLAGFCTKLLVYPLDLAKKRLQIQGFAQNRQTFGQHFVCRHMFHCLVQVGRYEGLRGLYKGLLPSLLKAGCTSAFYFTIYDSLMVLFNSKSSLRP